MGNNKIVVYTAIFGGYDGLLPQPKMRGIDFVCFTDRPIKASPWVVKNVATRFSDPVRCAKEFKILPHHFFPDHEYSIWIDGNFLLVGDIHALIDNVLSKSTMACFNHLNTEIDSRNCIYKEYDAIMEQGRATGHFKDDPSIMQLQIERYRKEGYPDNAGLFSGGVLCRCHHDSSTKRCMEAWWDEICHGSRRDQLSFNYITWKLGFKVHYLPGDIRKNPWFYLIGIHRKDYRAKLFRYRLKRFLGLLKHQ